MWRDAADDQWDRLIPEPYRRATEPEPPEPEPVPVGPELYYVANRPKLNRALDYAYKSGRFTRLDLALAEGDYSGHQADYIVKAMVTLGVIRYHTRVWRTYADGSAHLVTQYQWCAGGG